MRIGCFYHIFLSFGLFLEFKVEDKSCLFVIFTVQFLLPRGACLLTPLLILSNFFLINWRIYIIYPIIKL